MNKRLIIIFVCLAIFVLTLVVGAVVFTVSDVNILLQSDKNVAFDKTKILETSGIKKGQSIFTIDSDEAKAKIEKQFPKLNVIKIERAFPNKVRIHLDARTAILKIPVANSDKFLLLDYRFDEENKISKIKILDMVIDDGEIYDDEKVVLVNGYEYSCGDNPVGDFISDDNVQINALKDILHTLDTLEVVNERVPATFDSISIAEDNTIRLKTVLGLTLVIRTETTVSVQRQMEIIYTKFYSYQDEDREKPNYLYINNNGDLINSPKIEFN